MHVLDVWYSRLDDKTLIATAPNAEVRRYREHIAAKAHASLGEYLFPRITGLVDGRRRIVDQPPLIFHFPEPRYTEAGVPKLLSEYCKTLPAHMVRLLNCYHFEDFAFKVVGVGSVGTCSFIVLLLAGSDDPLLLQVKEARPSVLEPYAGKSEFNHQGQRVVVGQRLMQSASDMFLGWMTSQNGTQYYVRQLRDMKYSIPLEGMKADFQARYATVCGWVLARAHAKGGDAAMITGYLGRKDLFDVALGKFALAYADQTERDYDSLVKAVKSGRVQGTLCR